MDNAAEKLPEDEPAADKPDPLVGSILNQKFKILSLLATGGMGVIYRGTQLALERPVAIKVLTPNATSSQIDPNFHKRFFLEASILARLQHPNIVTVFDYGRVENMEPERYFMAMEFLEGETLFRRMRKDRCVAPSEAMNIARQIARGLREAHKHGVVHRDLKPSNIMLVPGEDLGELVKILDFGLVKVVADDSEELTQQGSFLGSPRFMSPEQISHGKVDLRTDIYSLGIILYQMLCGKVPFEAPNSVQILIAHLQQPVPPMRERSPDVEVPEALEAFVRRCLSKDPEGRPANMDAFIKGLGDCAQAMGLSNTFGSTGLVTVDSGGGVHMPTPMPPVKIMAAPPTAKSDAHDGAASAEAARAEGASHSTRPAEPAQKKRGVLFAVVGAVAVLGVGLGVGLGGGSKEQPTPAPTPTPTGAAAEQPDAKGQKSFTLMIESIPAGAEVVEDGKPLGTTPLQLSVSNDSVREQPRRLTVRLEGYQPYSIVQGPSEQSVRLVATLNKSTEAAPSAPTKAEPATQSGPRPHRPRPTPTPEPEPTPPPGPKPLDIKIER